MAAKQANDASSASTAGRTHHQWRFSNAVVTPDSSSVCALRTQTARTRTATANRYLATGHSLRRAERWDENRCRPGGSLTTGAILRGYPARTRPTGSMAGQPAGPRGNRT